MISSLQNDKKILQFIKKLQDLTGLTVSISSDPGGTGNSSPQENSEKDISIPINLKSKTVGCLRVSASITSPSKSLGREIQSLDLFHKLADVLGQMLDLNEQNQLLEQKLNRVKDLDILTGLKNHRSGMMALEELIKRSHESLNPFAVAVLNLDHFGILNDLHGVKVGDRFLVMIADKIKSEVRESDMVFRDNGARFLVLMPDTRFTLAEQVAEEIKHAIEALHIDNVTNWHPVVNLGVASWKFGMTSVDELLEAVDIALFRYRRKRVRKPEKPQSSRMSGGDVLPVSPRIHGFIQYRNPHATTSRLPTISDISSDSKAP